MGAWIFVQPRFDALLADLHGGDCNHRVAYAGRKAAASPATGSAALHARQQAELLASALGIRG